MANVRKSNRVSDTDIVRLNHAGLSLKAIADLLGCHPATITLRMKAMGTEPFDTRRSFMEEVFKGLESEEGEWISHHLFNNQISIKHFVTNAIKDACKNAPPLPVATVEQPVMQTLETIDAEFVTEPSPYFISRKGLTSLFSTKVGAFVEYDPAEKTQAQAEAEADQMLEELLDRANAYEAKHGAPFQQLSEPSTTDQIPDEVIEAAAAELTTLEPEMVVAEELAPEVVAEQAAQAANDPIPEALIKPSLFA